MEQSWTYGELARQLRYRLDGTYDVLVSNTDLLLQNETGVFVQLRLESDATECNVTFSSGCQPHTAAHIALLINDIIPTYVDSGRQFTAERVGGGHYV